jgi:hypothetical protein
LEGVYIFRLTVTDNKSATASDEVRVTVTSVNQNPIVNAGADETLVLPTNFTSFTASASDPDGTIATYAWTQQSGPSLATLVGTAAATVDVSGLIIGTYVFRITVTDNDGGQSFDEARVIVQAATNVNPIANAGSNVTIFLPTNTVVLPGSGSDSDGTIQSYTWSRISGGAATLSNQNTATLTASDLAAGTYR